ncbi:hypothetical protein AM571_PB00265 (plasmid) [Rhizobium etli 8C-3]|uniref:Uncharacterized protein n=1 Tax=Rhizobium etli 8C-3 TaxID=538025 RepID=A0A1L5PBS8_RHIET|nr:hypothetical protein AM571_PB00265 [Rhizobium etli 8C-3]
MLKPDPIMPSRHGRTLYATACRQSSALDHQAGTWLERLASLPLAMRSPLKLAFI